jgi:CPA2 family monovalent cation:H+ antiporter-2
MASVAVVVGKTALTAFSLRAFGLQFAYAAATGVCLAQVGEFSIVLARIAVDSKLLDADGLRLIVSVTIGTLFVTPYLIACAPSVAKTVGRWTSRRRDLAVADSEADDASPTRGHVIIVGFGPAGQRAAEGLMQVGFRNIVVIDFSARSAELAAGFGLKCITGDAARHDVLEEAHVHSAAVFAVTIPDPAAARGIIEQVRVTAPNTPIIARARYHIARWQLSFAGAAVVVDEEDHVGHRIALGLREMLDAK